MHFLIIGREWSRSWGNFEQHCLNACHSHKRKSRKMHLHLLSETHQASLPSYGPRLPQSVSLILCILLLLNLQNCINPTFFYSIDYQCCFMDWRFQALWDTRCTIRSCKWPARWSRLDPSLLIWKRCAPNSRPANQTTSRCRNCFAVCTKPSSTRERGLSSLNVKIT